MNVNLFAKYSIRFRPEIRTNSSTNSSIFCIEPFSESIENINNTCPLEDDPELLSKFAGNPLGLILVNQEGIK